jgi:hypothetical protein
VRVFSWGLVIRGFDLDEGLLLDRGRIVEKLEFTTSPVSLGGLP